LLANCEQVGQIVYNSTGRTAGQLALYEDLWKFTLLNYNAGPGCLSQAIRQTVGNKQALTWQNVVQYLEPACQAGVAYVDDIANMIVVEAPGIGDLLSTPEPEIVQTTPTPVPTARPTATPTSIYTPMPTPTQGTYPVTTPTSPTPPTPYP